MSDEHDARLAALRDIANHAAVSALSSNAEALAHITALEAAGYRIRLTVGVALQRAELAADAVRRLMAERRTCPHCSTPEAPFHLRGHFVRDRVRGSNEPDVLEGSQVRFTCSLCGYGEVEPIPADT